MCECGEYDLCASGNESIMTAQFSARVVVVCKCVNMMKIMFGLLSPTQCTVRNFIILEDFYGHNNNNKI